MIPRRALITGASSGIGRSIAIALSTPGSELFLAGRSRDRLENVATNVRSRGAVAHVHVVDLGDDAAVQDFVRGIFATGDSLDVVVHSAGAVALGRVENAAVGDLDRQYSANVRAPYLLTQLLLPLVRKARGQFVFVNSGAGLHARAGWGQYAMTKHALRALADCLREEVGGEGIRVLSVYPGRTATPMQEDVHRMEGREYDAARFLSPDDVASEVVHALGLPERATVIDLSIRPTRG